MSKILSFKPAPAATANVGARGFFNWLRAKQPQIYRAVMVRLPQHGGLAGLGIMSPGEAVTVSSEPVKPSVADRIKDIVFGVSQAYLTAQQLSAQKKVLDMQLERAKAGLAPLDINMAQYGLTGPQVTVGMSPETKNLLIWGGAGLAAILIVPKLLGRR